ncbi:MAG: hypothetical protein K2X43_09600 [Hyphomonadaceae bacterium]|nr:hypothetical protein [Hyphomonadaceae bacterium]
MPRSPESARIKLTREQVATICASFGWPRLTRRAQDCRYTDGWGQDNNRRGDLQILRIHARLGRVLAAGLLTCVFAGLAATMADDGLAESAVAEAPAAGASDAHFETFLDRLMRAESNGRDFAANPRSTALGPFQFIKATFIDVARRHFAEVASLSDEQILALRTNRATARRAAAIYSMENLAYLSGRGLQPSFGDLRLAYLVGPTAAARLLEAHPQTPAGTILGASVVRANPFMAGMSASQLIARSARDVGEHQRTSVAAAPDPRRRILGIQPAPRVQLRPGGPSIAVACNQKLIACQRWIAMQANKLRVAQQQAAKQAAAARRAASRASVPGKRDNRPGV